MHQARPLAEDRTIGRKDCVKRHEIVDPDIQLICLCRVLLARELDSRLRFGENYRRNGELMRGN